MVDIIVFNSIHGQKFRVPSELYRADGDLALLSWLFSSVRASFASIWASAEERHVALQIWGRLWSASFASSLAHVVDDFTNYYNAKTPLHFEFQQLIGPLVASDLEAEGASRLYNYISATRNLVALYLRRLSPAAKDAVTLQRTTLNQIKDDIGFGCMRSSRLGSSSLVMGVNQALSDEPPMINTLMISDVIKSWHDLARLAFVSTPPESGETLPSMNSCRSFSKRCHHTLHSRHGRLTVWTISVLLICDCVRVLADASIYLGLDASTSLCARAQSLKVRSKRGLPKLAPACRPSWRTTCTAIAS